MKNYTKDQREELERQKGFDDNLKEVIKEINYDLEEKRKYEIKKNSHAKVSFML